MWMPSASSTTPTYDASCPRMWKPSRAVMENSSAPTPMGASSQHPVDEAHHHVVEPLDDVLEPLRGLARGERQAQAEDEREDDEANHVPVRRGLHRVGGHHGHEERARGGVPGGGAALMVVPVRARARASSLRPSPGLQRVDEQQADEHGDDGEDDGVAQRAGAQPSHLLQVQLRHADDERGEQQRHDEHQQQADEDLPHGVGDVLHHAQMSQSASPEHARWPRARPPRRRKCRGASSGGAS